MSELRLRVGGMYRTRDGRTAEIVEDDGGLRWPFRAEFACEEDGWYSRDGKCACKDYPDLIFEIEEPKEAPMVRMVVRDEKREPEKVIEWWLDTYCGDVVLKAGDGAGKEKFVLRIQGDGTIFRSLNASLPGLKTDADGRIKVID